MAETGRQGQRARNSRCRPRSNERRPAQEQDTSQLANSGQEIDAINAMKNRVAKDATISGSSREKAVKEQCGAKRNSRQDEMLRCEKALTTSKATRKIITNCPTARYGGSRQSS